MIALSFKDPMRHKKLEVTHLDQMKGSLIYSWNHKKIRWLFMFGSVLIFALTMAFWYYQPYMQLINIDIKFFGIAFAALNKPRLVTAFGIIEAAEKEIKERCCNDVEADPSCIGKAGSPTEVIEAFELPLRRKGEIMTGVPEEAIKKAIEKIRELGGADLLL